MLAKWIANEKNPLTARVFVNRLWKQFFGTGLSKVLDDMGAQGEPPVNAALLDWLACEFRDGGWDVKRMVRTIVTSATYRQDSRVMSSFDRAAVGWDKRSAGPPMQSASCAGGLLGWR